MAVGNHSAQLLLLGYVWTLCLHKWWYARTFGQYARKMSDVRPLLQVLQWWTEVNYQQISYMTLIGVYSTMHLVHPNLCHGTTVCLFVYVCVCVCVCAHVCVCVHCKPSQVYPTYMHTYMNVVRNWLYWLILWCVPGYEMASSVFIIRKCCKIFTIHLASRDKLLVKRVHDCVK